MTDVECIHGLEVGTCSLCKPATPDPNIEVAEINVAAVATAIAGMPDTFRTRDVASHDAVTEHRSFAAGNVHFAKQVGTFLSHNTTRLGIRRVPPLNQANATWQKRVPLDPDTAAD
jgi:hypothetical protein